jgi:tRNA A-37 threonylcarbamoyl transferase component Bud32/tetratricopeptide (TPR) repeat protein
MISIPNYEIGKLAGRGGVAEVYLARHKLLDRTVAIKLISPTNADDLADKRFLKEAKVVAGLRHPNIVSIYDVGVYENKYYIIMEYLEGGDLKQNIKRSLSIPQILKIIRQIASALAHAHDKGFVHRDIKSQNIMFRGDGTAVLTDFGIVKDLTTDSGYTMDGTSIGTPHYMSPEQVQGTGEVDWRTDLYSLGVTFFEMITGSVPYNADSPIAVALKHIKDPVPELPEKFAEFQPIINRLIAKKADDRFQSAHELLTALGKLDGETAPTDTVVMHHGPAKKIKLANIFTGVLIGCILVGLAVLIQPHIASFIKGPPETPDPPALEISGTAEVETPASRRPLPAAAAPDTKKKSPSHGMEAAGLTDLIAKKDYSGVLNAISRIRREIPDTGNDMIRKADEFLDSGQYMNAGDIFNTVLSVDPQNNAAVTGLLYVAVEKQQSVLTAESPTAADYDLLMAILNKATESTDTPYFKMLKIDAVESIYEKARHLMEQQDFNQAAVWAESGLKNAPDHLRLQKLIYLIQANISLAENRLTIPEENSALAYFQKVLQLDPNDSSAKQGIKTIADRYKTLALNADSAKDGDKALELITKARSIDPADPALAHLEWLIRGDRHAAQGQFTVPENQNARYFYQKILDEDPENKDAARRIAELELAIPLYQLRQTPSLAEKIPAYRTLFAKLDAAAEPAALKKQLLQQIETDIQNQKNINQPMPQEFMTLIAERFPDEKKLFTTQYDIFIAMGENASKASQKTDYFLKALKLDPTLPAAKETIEKTARHLDDGGQTDSAVQLLQQAMEIVPSHPPFKTLYQEIIRSRDTRAELFTLLLKIKRLPSFAEKVPLYEKLFQKMTAAEKTFGVKKLANLKNDAATQVKADIAARKNARQMIPEDFMVLLGRSFPEIKKDAQAAQYDILVENGDRSDSWEEKTDDYLKALDLDTGRETAKEKIALLAANLEKNGNNSAAVAILEKALAVLPNELIFSELFDKINRTVDVYPISAGCGRENMISQAPVSIQDLGLCIEYRNLPEASVVNVTVTQPEVQTMEIPVILQGRSGSMSVNIPAPVEGFATGEYEIIVKQDTQILSENRIQIIPERR